MAETIGSKRWAIAEGYIPGGSTGSSRQMTSHETACILNAGERDAHVEITDLAGDGDHYAARVVAESFRGMSRVGRQRLVYDALGGRMGGELHALQLTTALPDQE